LLSFAWHLKHFYFLFFVFPLWIEAWGTCKKKFNVNWGFEAFVEALVVFDFVTPRHLKKSDICEFKYFVWLFERVETHSYSWTCEMEFFQCELIVSWEFKGNKSSLLGGDGRCIQIIGLRISSFTRSVFFIKKNKPWEPQSKTMKHPCTQPIHS
jgi:hypothetical protein